MNAESLHLKLIAIVSFPIQFRGLQRSNNKKVSQSECLFRLLVHATDCQTSTHPKSAILHIVKSLLYHNMHKTHHILNSGNDSTGQVIIIIFIWCLIYEVDVCCMIVLPLTLGLVTWVWRAVMKTFGLSVGCYMKPGKLQVLGHRLGVWGLASD